MAELSVRATLGRDGNRQSQDFNASGIAYKVSNKSDKLTTKTWQTTEETIQVPAELLNSLGYVICQNEDANNYCDFGFAAAVYPLRFLPAAAGIFPSTPAQPDFRIRFNSANGVFMIRMMGA